MAVLLRISFSCIPYNVSLLVENFCYGSCFYFNTWQISANAAILAAFYILFFIIFYFLCWLYIFSLQNSFSCCAKLSWIFIGRGTLSVSLYVCVCVFVCICVCVCAHAQVRFSLYLRRFYKCEFVDDKF